MQIYVHADQSAELHDVDDFRGFAVVVDQMPATTMRQALLEVGRQTDDATHIFVDPAWITKHAGTRAGDDGWKHSFAAMTRYAAERGWVDDTGRIRAHVEMRPV